MSTRQPSPRAPRADRGAHGRPGSTSSSGGRNRSSANGNSRGTGNGARRGASSGSPAGAPGRRDQGPNRDDRRREGSTGSSRPHDSRRPSPRAGESAPSTPRPSAVDTAPRIVIGSTDFAELGVPAPVVAALAAEGITSAFPIQQSTLPDSLAGLDLVGRGRTGSGKTVAFCLPTVAGIARRGNSRQPRRPAGLILVPTRELAAQVADTLRPLAAALGQRIAVIHGGVSMGPQVTSLSRGVDILVATPGRLEDLMAQGHCVLDRIEVTVLDEADHMADLGFLPVVKRILDKTPRDGQRLLFSATIDNGVDVLVNRYLSNPAIHSVDSAESPVPEMDHHILTVPAGEKGNVVHALAAGAGRTLLFTRTKHGARKLARQLTQAGIPAVDLHGNLSQNARTRNLDAFSAGEVTVLVATDIAARGIHVDEVGLVVHVDPPAEHKAYLHRSGRTARAGARGTVVTIQTPDQTRDVDDLLRKAKIQPTRTQVSGSHPLLRELAGAPVARRSMPASLTAPAASASSGGGRSGASGGASGAGRSGARGARPGAPGARAGGRGRRSPRA